jgi:phosphate uptake regulator
MEIRKVQLTGGSSYVITLPKEWITSLKIKKNDPLGLITQPDGSLVITTRTQEQRPQRARELRAEDFEDPEHLFRILIGSYIMGFSTITVRAQGKIPAHTRETIRKFTQITIGPEIMEEGPAYITIRDLLNPAEMPFDKTVKRMHMLVRSMHEDAIAALEKGNGALADEVVSRDSEVNRLQWLIARQSNMLMNDITLSKRLGLSLEEALTYLLISRIIERIGDHAVKIAKCTSVLIPQKGDRHIQQSMRLASVAALVLLGASLESWFKRDLRTANQNIDGLPALQKQCDGINTQAQHLKSIYSIAATDIAESIRRTGEYSADISELVINSLMVERK